MEMVEKKTHSNLTSRGGQIGILLWTLDQSLSLTEHQFSQLSIQCGYREGLYVKCPGVMPGTQQVLN